MPTLKIKQAYDFPIPDYLHDQSWLPFDDSALAKISNPVEIGNQHGGMGDWGEHHPRPGLIGVSCSKPLQRGRKESGNNWVLNRISKDWEMKHIQIWRHSLYLCSAISKSIGSQVALRNILWLILEVSDCGGCLSYCKFGMMGPTLILHPLAEGRIQVASLGSVALRCSLSGTFQKDIL